MRYILTEKVLTALLALSHRESMLLISAFEQIAANPGGSAERLMVDWEDRLALGLRFGRFEIAYAVDDSSGRVTITLARPYSGAA